MCYGLICGVMRCNIYVVLGCAVLYCVIRINVMRRKSSVEIFLVSYLNMLLQHECYHSIIVPYYLAVFLPVYRYGLLSAIHLFTL